MGRRGARRRGFTLLEILCAIGLMGTAMVAVAGAIDTCAERILAARENLVAARLADARLQEALALDDPEAAAGAGVGDEDRRFQYTVEVRDEPVTLAELELGKRNKLIEVVVTWRHGERRLVVQTRALDKASRGGS